MDTQKLKYILEIAEAGNITRASERLFISQSGLNQQLKLIEKQLGVTLFERDTHNFEITEAGELFLAYAKETINREEQMHTMLQDTINGDIGELKVNIAMEQGLQLFTHILPSFYEKYPKVEVKLEDHIVKDQYRLLRDRQLDLGMVMVPVHHYPELEYIHLATEELLLGIPMDHPLAEKYPHQEEDHPYMDLALCKDEQFALMFSGSTLRETIDPCFENAGFYPNILMESRTNHIIAQMASSGLCLTILPESQANLYPKLRWYHLLDQPTWESCLIYHKERPPRKAARYLIQLAVDYSKKHSK